MVPRGSGPGFQDRKSVWLSICKLHLIKNGITQGLLFAKPTKGILTAGAALRSLKSSQSTGTFPIGLSVCGEEVFFSSKGTENHEECAFWLQLLGSVLRKVGNRCWVWGPLLGLFLSTSLFHPLALGRLCGQACNLGTEPCALKGPVFALRFCRCLWINKILNKGPCIFIYQWAPQMTQPVLPSLATCTRVRRYMQARMRAHRHLAQALIETACSHLYKVKWVEAEFEARVLSGLPGFKSSFLGWATRPDVFICTAGMAVVQPHGPLTGVKRGKVRKAWRVRECSLQIRILALGSRRFACFSSRRKEGDRQLPALGGPACPPAPQVEFPGPTPASGTTVGAAPLSFSPKRSILKLQLYIYPCQDLHSVDDFCCLLNRSV